MEKSGGLIKGMILGAMIATALTFFITKKC